MIFLQPETHSFRVGFPVWKKSESFAMMISPSLQRSEIWVIISRAYQPNEKAMVGNGVTATSGLALQ